MSIGSVSETILVTAAPPVINTSNAELGRTVTADEINGLPLVNRNAYSEVSLTRGVQSNTGSSLQSFTPFTTAAPTQPPAEDVVINGGIDSGTPMGAYYLDGAVNMTAIRNYGSQLPNPDALQEFRVETAAFPAQYGRFATAVVTALTRSGINSFHGSLFEFNRNTDFNATPWGTHLKQPFHRNNFGATLGGPVYKEKKLRGPPSSHRKHP